MSGRCIAVGGEAYLHLRVVAECYQIEPIFLEEAYELGLLGDGLLLEGELAIAAIHLDRAARIVALHRSLGVELAALLVWLEPL